MQTEDAFRESVAWSLRVTQHMSDISIGGPSARLRALRTLEEAARRWLAEQWQPISTAPKDDTPILLFLDNVIIQGNGLHPITLNSHGCGCCSDSNGPITHWRPLPAPPEGIQLNETKT